MQASHGNVLTLEDGQLRNQQGNAAPRFVHSGIALVGVACLTRPMGRICCSRRRLERSERGCSNEITRCLRLEAALVSLYGGKAVVTGKALHFSCVARNAGNDERLDGSMDRWGMVMKAAM